MSEADTTGTTLAQETVTPDEVRHVADLASLELTADELPRLAGDLNSILGYVGQLNELDTAEVPPITQVGDILAGGSAQQLAQGGRTLRADTIRPSLDRKLVMAEAPETDGRFFKVPKVIER